MTFVGEAVTDGGLSMWRGEFKVYTGRLVRPVLMPGRGFAKPYPDCSENMSVSAMSRPELEVRLAAAGLRMRKFPCASYARAWRLYGTEAST